MICFACSCNPALVLVRNFPSTTRGRAHRTPRTLPPHGSPRGPLQPAWEGQQLCQPLESPKPYLCHNLPLTIEEGLTPALQDSHPNQLQSCHFRKILKITLVHSLHSVSSWEQATQAIKTVNYTLPFISPGTKYHTSGQPDILDGQMAHQHVHANPAPDLGNSRI